MLSRVTAKNIGDVFWDTVYRPPTQTTDDDQTAKTPKMLRGGVWGGGCVPVLKILEFYSWKCYILVHLLPSVVTIIRGHWPIGGTWPSEPRTPLNTPLIVRWETYFDIMNRMWLTSVTDGQTDRTAFNNSMRRALKTQRNVKRLWRTDLRTSVCLLTRGAP